MKIKTTIITVVGVALIVLIAGYAYYSQTFAPAPAVTATTTASQPGVNANAASGSSAHSSTSAAATTTVKGVTGSPAAPAAVPGNNLTLGLSGGTKQHLVAYNGHALYTYDADKAAGPTSACTAGCALAWPPYEVTTTSNLVAEYPIGGTISTIKRPDSKIQVTYNGRPLYFFAGDVSDTDARGDGSDGVWHLATP